MSARDMTAPPEAAARALLIRLRADIAAVPTGNTLSLNPVADVQVSGNLKEGLDLTYRHGIVRFRDSSGGGYRIDPDIDTIAILNDDSLYLRLVVAPPRAIVASTKVFDLEPKIPGYRLYVYYKENPLLSPYPASQVPTRTERKIYEVIARDLAK